MKNILLVCGAGMSTSILVTKMQEADLQNEYRISCSDTISAGIAMVDSDILLLAPHISYLKDEYLQKCETIGIPFLVIATEDYTKMDGASVLIQVGEILENYEKENPFKVVLLHTQGGVMSDLIAMDMKAKLSGAEVDWVIESYDIDKFIDDGSADIILLEPQIKYEKNNLKKILKKPLTVVDAPTIGIYSTLNGRKILDYIHKAYDENVGRQKNIMKEEIEKL